MQYSPNTMFSQDPWDSMVDKMQSGKTNKQIIWKESCPSLTIKLVSNTKEIAKEDIICKIGEGFTEFTHPFCEHYGGIIFSEVNLSYSKEENFELFKKYYFEAIGKGRLKCWLLILRDCPLKNFLTEHIQYTAISYEMTFSEPRYIFTSSFMEIQFEIVPSLRIEDNNFFCHTDDRIENYLETLTRFSSVYYKSNQKYLVLSDVLTFFQQTRMQARPLRSITFANKRHSCENRCNLPNLFRICRLESNDEKDIRLYFFKTLDLYASIKTENPRKGEIVINFYNTPMEFFKYILSELQIPIAGAEREFAHFTNQSTFEEIKQFLGTIAQRLAMSMPHIITASASEELAASRAKLNSPPEELPRKKRRVQQENTEITVQDEAKS